MKQAQKETIKNYTQILNTLIKEEKEKNLYDLLIFHMPFIKHFEVWYKSNKNKLKDATQFEDILLSGISDIINIVKEDGLGIKNYNLLEDENLSLEHFINAFEDKYPSYLELDIIDDIEDDIYRLEQQNQQNTTFYKELVSLSLEIKKLQKVFIRRYKIRNTLIKLQWKFTKLNLAITLIYMEEIASYDEVKRLEEEAKKISTKLLKSVKKHDKDVKKL